MRVVSSADDSRFGKRPIRIGIKVQANLGKERNYSSFKTGGKSDRGSRGCKSRNWGALEMNLKM